MQRALWLALMLWSTSLLGCPEESAEPDGARRTDAALADVVLEVDATILRDAYFPPADTGPGCGEVPATGECTPAGVLRWCEDGAVEEADCAALELTCAAQPDLGGYWCLAGPGQSCQDWPCFTELTCTSHRICVGVIDGGAEDRPSAEDHPSAEDAAADAGPEDHPAANG